MRSMKRLMLLWICLSVPGGPPALAGQPAQYAVIVNPANSYQDSLENMKQVVRQLFLKQRTRWPDRTSVKPFGRSPDSPEHKIFLQVILQMSDFELANHWISVKQKTGQAQPREISRDSLVLKLVERYEGGLAVVSRQTAESDNTVRILFTFTG